MKEFHMPPTPTLIQNWKSELESWGWLHVELFHDDRQEEALQSARAGRLVNSSTIQSQRKREWQGCREIGRCIKQMNPDPSRRKQCFLNSKLLSICWPNVHQSSMSYAIPPLRDFGLNNNMSKKIARSIIMNFFSRDFAYPWVQFKASPIDPWELGNPFAFSD